MGQSGFPRLQAWVVQQRRSRRRWACSPHAAAPPRKAIATRRCRSQRPARAGNRCEARSASVRHGTAERVQAGGQFCSQFARQIAQRAVPPRQCSPSACVRRHAPGAGGERLQAPRREAADQTCQRVPGPRRRQSSRPIIELPHRTVRRSNDRAAALQRHSRVPAACSLACRRDRVFADSLLALSTEVGHFAGVRRHHHWLGERAMAHD